MKKFTNLAMLAIATLSIALPALAITRTAIMKQEEAQTERSVQLRASDPGAPVSNQLWLNTTENIGKYYNGSSTVQVGAKKGANADITSMTGFTGVLETPTVIKMTEQGSTPATPAAGLRKIYTKSDGLYQLDSAGLESKVGTGSGGGGGTNLLTTTENFDFEAGTTSWTASGGTFTAISSGQLYGLQSGQWTASASSQTLYSASVPLTRQPALESNNCLAAISYSYASGASGDYSLVVSDGTNVLASTSLNVTTTTQDTVASFICPASGSLKVGLISNVASPSAIKIDGASFNSGQVLLGSNVLVNNITQSQQILSAYIAKSTNCTWSVTNTAFTAFGSNANCNNPTTIEYSAGVGSPQTTNSNLPQVTINNLPAGTYTVFGQSLIVNGANVYCVAIGDGTTTSGASCHDGNTTNMGFTAIGTFTYTSAGNRTFALYGSSSSGAISLTNQSGNQRVNFVIMKSPGAAQQALSTDQTPQNWNGYQSGCSFTTTSTSFADAPASGCSITATNATNMSISAAPSGGNSLPGITWTPSALGSYLVCVDTNFSTNTVTSASAQMRLVDGNGNVLSGSGSLHYSGTAFYIPYTACGIVPVSSVSPVTVKLQMRSSSGAITVGISNTENDHAVDWHVIFIASQLSTPILLNSVTSNSSSVTRINSAYITGGSDGTNCSSSPCTIGQQTGSWLTSVTRTGSGQYTLNLPSGEYSSRPNCVANRDHASTAITCDMVYTGSTATAMKVACINSSFNNDDAAFSIVCHGYH